MVYNWDGKEDECFRLYVQEKKSLDEVLQYWEGRGFTPSKQNPAHKNPALIARVQQLWENNVMQKDMLDILHGEGFEISDRELVRLRLKFKWLLRESRTNEYGNLDKPPKKKKQKRSGAKRANVSLIEQLADAILREDESSEEDDSDDQGEPSGPPDQLPTPTPQHSSQPEARSAPEAPHLSPEELRRRQEHIAQLKAESDERWRTRKRRRRTRGWAGLPADAPGEPPRFPSETTLDESKAYLGLSNGEYRHIRDQFQAICEESEVIKKTVAGPEKWGRVKERLIHENEHLSTVFQQDPEARQQSMQMVTPSNVKALSLDVICLDVTKRMRTVGTRMGIPDAKNVLGLNPEESRRIRKALVAKLQAEHFTSRLEIGDDRWNELKQAWIQESERLSQLLAPDPSDPKRAEKTKALEVLARDILKRFRQDSTKKDPSQKKQVNQGIGPGPAPPSVAPHASTSHRKQTGKRPTSTTTQSSIDLPTLSASSDLQIDPSLLLAANDPSVIPQPTTSSHYQPQSHHHPYTVAVAPSYYSNAPLPIFFRLHPHSSASMPNKSVWLGILQSGTVSEIRNLAIREQPGT
ncbi:hypothetical protein BCR34DRAFT_451940, partial [Clohesyomyces aquaticus]